MKVIAQQTPEVFLVQFEDDRGCIVDIGIDKAYPATSIQAILKHGYWERPTALDLTLRKAMTLASGQS